jgi:uncharacterized membrane protein HdeD (DUF308 family)
VALVAVLAGLYAVVHPGNAAKALTWVVGVWLLVRGLVEVVGAFGRGLDGSTRAALGISALVDFLLGGIFVANPGKSVVGVTTLLGIVAVVWGVVLVVLALVARRHLDDLAGGAPVQPA